MGQSTDGQICYGFKFDEGHEFPWDEHDDIEAWWLDIVHGYKPPFEMYTPEGNYVGGKRWPDEKINEYYVHRNKFEESLPPLPVKLVNYCSGDYPMYILAVPQSYKEANRGSPEAFDPSELVVTEHQQAALWDFCKTHGIEHDEPRWWLSSYWE